MAGFSDFAENEILDHVFGNSAYTIPTTYYFALYTANPTDAGGGTEVSGGSYARVAVTNNTTNFPAASGGSKSNGTAVTFPTATANWGTVTSVGIFDASTAGNLIAWNTLTTSKTIDNGDTASFAASSLTFTLD
jgi:hypothetical protein